MSMSAQQAMNTIDRFIQQVGATTEKRAGFKKKADEANTEAGSIGGDTEHPVADVDDSTEPAKEGERSAENESDNKEDQPAGVDSTPEASKTAFDLSRFAKPTKATAAKPVKPVKRAADGGAVSTPGSASDDQLQIGTKKEPTGEDPSVETGSAKAGKEDPGSTHPARTDNDSLDGEKYSADLNNMPLEKLAAELVRLGDSICADIAVGGGSPAPQRQKAASAQPAQPNLAQQAGWELAGLVNGTFDKQAADSLVHSTLQEIIKTAQDDADNVIEYLANYDAGLRKLAEDPMGGGGGMPPPMDPSQIPGAGGPPGAGGMPGGPPPGGGGEGDMLAALGGGDPSGGGMPPPGGGDPSGGGMPPDDGSGGGDPAAELAQILDELGITPEDLQQKLQEIQGGGGAGGPGGGAGGPPPGGASGDDASSDPDPSGGMEASASDRRRVKTAGVKKGTTHVSVKDYLQELMLRSRN